MKSPQQIKIDLAKKRRAKAEQQHSESTKLQTELLDELRSLNESINDQKTIDISELSDQVSKISEAVDIKEQLELLAAKLDFKPQEVDLSGIEMAIKDSKPVINVDLEDMKKAIIEIRQRVEENIVPAPEPGQLPEDYRPYRRVIKAGNRLIFDDNITSASRGGGGVDTTGLATTAKQDEIVTAIGSITTTPKPTDAYSISNIEATATYKYFGFEDKDGAWYIMRKTLADNTFLYTAGASDYSTAWTDRASQSYASYGSTF